MALRDKQGGLLLPKKIGKDWHFKDHRVIKEDAPIDWFLNRQYKSHRWRKDNSIQGYLEEYRSSPLSFSLVFFTLTKEGDSLVESGFDPSADGLDRAAWDSRIALHRNMVDCCPRGKRPTGLEVLLKPGSSGFYTTPQYSGLGNSLLSWFSRGEAKGTPFEFLLVDASPFHQSLASEQLLSQRTAIWKAQTATVSENIALSQYNNIVSSLQRKFYGSFLHPVFTQNTQVVRLGAGFVSVHDHLPEFSVENGINQVIGNSSTEIEDDFSDFGKPPELQKTASQTFNVESRESSLTSLNVASATEVEKMVKKRVTELDISEEEDFFACHQFLHRELDRISKIDFSTGSVSFLVACPLSSLRLSAGPGSTSGKLNTYNGGLWIYAVATGEWSLEAEQHVLGLAYSLANFYDSDISTQAEKFIRRLQANSARAAVLARNFSHIIGSHVLSNPHFIASLLTNTSSLESAMTSLQRVTEMIVQIRKTLNTSERSSPDWNSAWMEGQEALAQAVETMGSTPNFEPVIRFHRYLQGRFDFIARAVEDQHDRPEPVFWVGDVVDGFRSQDAYLNTLVSDLGLDLEKMEIVLHFDHPTEGEKELTYRGGWDVVDGELIFNDWSKGECCGDDGYPNPYKIATLVGFPGGMTTVHALYALLENVIRNSVKYGTARKYTQSEVKEVNGGTSGGSEQVKAGTLKPYELHLCLKKGEGDYLLQIWDNYSGTQDIGKFELDLLSKGEDFSQYLTDDFDGKIWIGEVDGKILLKARAWEPAGEGDAPAIKEFEMGEGDVDTADGNSTAIFPRIRETLAQYREIEDKSANDVETECGSSKEFEMERIEREILRLATSFPGIPQRIRDDMERKAEASLITDTGELNRGALGLQEMKICAENLQYKQRLPNDRGKRTALRLLEAKDSPGRQAGFIPLTYEISLDKPVLLAMLENRDSTGQEPSDVEAWTSPYVRKFGNGDWDSLVDCGANLLAVDGACFDQDEFVGKLEELHTLLPYRILILCPNGEAGAWRKKLEASEKLPQRRVQVFAELQAALWNDLFGPDSGKQRDEDTINNLILRSREAWLRAWKPISPDRTWDLWIGFDRNAKLVQERWADAIKGYASDLIQIRVQARERETAKQEGDGRSGPSTSLAPVISKLKPGSVCKSLPTESDELETYWNEESATRRCQKRALVFDNHGECFENAKALWGGTNNKKWCRFYQEHGAANHDLFQTLFSPPSSPFGFAFFILNLVEACLTEVAVIDERLVSDLIFEKRSTAPNPSFSQDLQTHQRAAVWPVFTLRRKKGGFRGFYTSKQKEVLRDIVAMGFTGKDASDTAAKTKEAEELLSGEGILLVRPDGADTRQTPSQAKLLNRVTEAVNSGLEYDLLSGSCEEKDARCLECGGCDGVSLDAIVIHEGTLDLIHQDEEVKWTEGVGSQRDVIEENMRALWKLAPAVIRTSGRGRATKHFLKEIPFVEFSEVSGSLLTSKNKYALARAILGTSGSKEQGEP